jgi:transposase
LDSGQNIEAVSGILHVHPKTLKRWVKASASDGSDELASLMTERFQLFTAS